MCVLLTFPSVFGSPSTVLRMDFFQIVLITFKALAGLSGSNINMTHQGPDLSLRATDLQIK
jgi:hypothetical protein